jgi:glucose 1-dehydrogenase
VHGLFGKRAIVTGAATGIGQATAIRLAEEGVRVAVLHFGQADQAQDVLHAMKADSGPHLAVEADVASEAALEAAFAQVADAFGGLEYLVANAATKRINDPSDYPSADWDVVHGVNLKGAYLSARTFLKHRKGPTGAIVFVSSVHEITPLEEDIGYAASKAGLAGLTRTLALAQARKGVRVNNLAPGGVLTPMNPDWLNDPDSLRAFEEMVPLGRAAAPEEMASVAAFLLSDEASYITGHTLVADGGVMWGAPSH